MVPSSKRLKGNGPENGDEEQEESTDDEVDAETAWSLQPCSDYFTVRVGGEPFTLSPFLQSKILEKFPDSTIAAMLRSKDHLTTIDPFEGPVPSVFFAILNYALDGWLTVPANMSLNLLRQEMDFWIVPYDVPSLRYRNLVSTLNMNTLHGQLIHEEEEARHEFCTVAEKENADLLEMYQNIIWAYFVDKTLVAFLKKRVLEVSMDGYGKYCLVFKLRKCMGGVKAVFQWLEKHLQNLESLSGLPVKSVEWPWPCPGYTHASNLRMTFEWPTHSVASSFTSAFTTPTSTSISASFAPSSKLRWNSAQLDLTAAVMDDIHAVDIVEYELVMKGFTGILPEVTRAVEHHLAISDGTFTRKVLRI